MNKGFKGKALSAMDGTTSCRMHLSGVVKLGVGCPAAGRARAGLRAGHLVVDAG